MSTMQFSISVIIFNGGDPKQLVELLNATVLFPKIPIKTNICSAQNILNIKLECELKPRVLQLQLDIV